MRHLRPYRGRIIGAVLVLIVAISLPFLGIPASAFLNASLLTLGLTFVLQSFLQSLVAGLALLIDQPFDVGDTVTVFGFTGVVTHRHLRTTILDSGSETQTIVPNAVIITSPIAVNHPTPKER